MVTIQLPGKQLRTTTGFSQFLLEELGWRRKEIRFYRTLVDTRGAAQAALLRGAVTILYAHWEGFVKTGSSAYIEHVRQQGRRFGELTSNFVALGARKAAQQASHSARWKLQADFCEFVRTCTGDVCRWPKAWNVDTGSNLNVEVFRDIVVLLGIEYHPDFQLAEKPIIGRLLELRNGIAHGEGQFVDLAEYHQLHDRVDELLQLFCNEIDNAAARERYRIPQPAVIAPA
jgi:MAE_28990/MAE_18760-like HEPN